MFYTPLTSSCMHMYLVTFRSDFSHGLYPLLSCIISMEEINLVGPFGAIQLRVLCVAARAVRMMRYLCPVGSADVVLPSQCFCCSRSRACLLFLLAFFSVLETWSGESPRRTWRQYARTCPRGKFWERIGYTRTSWLG